MKIKLIDYGYKNAPKRAHGNDAGADVYIMQDTWVWGNDVAKIPLGFGLELPDGLAGFVISRSSLAAKGIVCEIPPIDSGYSGEIHAIVTNNTPHKIKLEAGDRIGQLVIMPVILAEFVENLGNERGDGAFGSTGK